MKGGCYEAGAVKGMFHGRGFYERGRVHEMGCHKKRFCVGGYHERRLLRRGVP